MGFMLGVPQPLEVRGLAARPRGGEEQVAAELEEEAGERGVVAARELLEPLVRGEGGVGGRAEVDRHAPEETLVLGDVVPADRVERAFRGSPQRGLHPRLGVAAHVLVGHEARGRGHEEGHRVRALHDQGVVLDADAAALRHGLEAGLVAQRPRARRGSRRTCPARRGRPCPGRPCGSSRWRSSSGPGCGRPGAGPGRRSVPGWSATRRTTITWSTGDANTSRVKATPPCS